MRHVHHLSDRDLVLMLDDDVPVRHRGAAQAHLADCASCQAKLAELEQGNVLAARLGQSARDATWMARSRARLESEIAAADRRGSSFIGRLVPQRGTASVWVSAGSALAVALVAVVLFPSVFRVPFERSAPVEHDALPVASLTPGATWGVSVEEVCGAGGLERRHVADGIRLEVLRRYAMERVPADQYELDYLITPELGGAPAVQNLWPQRYRARTWNAHVKDQLEDLLPRLVCEGTIALDTAQHDIAVDWVAAYKKYFHTHRPLRTHARDTAVASPVLAAFFDQRGRVVERSSPSRFSRGETFAVLHVRVGAE